MNGGGPGPRPSLRSLAGERELWILLAVVLLFFARPLFFGETFFFRDLSLLAFPQRLRLVELVRAGGLPLWDPYLHGGQPFLGNASNLALYPSGLLYFLLPGVAAFNVEIVLHFLFGAAAAYCLCRILGIDRVPSLAGGAVFALCGFTLSAANLLNRHLAMPNTVLLLLFWHLFLLEKKARWFGASAAAGALIVFAGSVEFLALALLLALPWAFAWSYPPGSLSPMRRAAAWIALAAGVLGVAAIQIWPGFEVVAQSSRGAGLDYATVAKWSLNPRRLPELFLPGYLGPTDTLAETSYWGARLEDGGYPLILSIFFGVPVLAFAAVEALARRDERLPRGFRRFLAAAAAAAVLLALGRFVLLKPLVFRALPLAGVFRFPIKALSAAVLPLAVLAAAGAGRLGRVSETPGQARPLLPALWTAAALFAAAGPVLASGGALSTTLERSLFLEEVARGEGTGRAGMPFFRAAAAAAALALILAAGRAGRRAWLPAALAGLVVADLAVAGISVNPYVSRELFSAEPPSVALVRRGLAGGRLYREANPPDRRFTVPANRLFWRVVTYRETLNDYIGNAFGIPVIFHSDYDGLEQRRLARLTEAVGRLDWERRLPLISAGGATVLIAADPLSFPGVELLGTLTGHSDLPFYAYRNSRAAPRVGFVSTSAFVETETDALKAVASRGFDPRRHVVLEGRAAPVRAGGCGEARIVEISRSPTSWSGRVSADCAGYLVFSEPFYPGWKVAVDGAPVPQLRANVAFSAIPLPAGTREVSRTYRPASVAAGAMLSAVSVFLVVFLGRLFARTTNRPGVPG